MSQLKFYGTALPKASLEEYTGKLLVIEGGDSSGRATQAKLLQDSIERLGYPTSSLLLLRSGPLAPELMNRARLANVCARTLSLFYATAFVDQLEQEILPALRAGSIVIVSGYVHRLISKSIIAGAELDWLTKLYGVALKPHSVVYLNVNPEELAARTFTKRAILDNWAYGRVFDRSQNVYKSFINHQKQFDITMRSIKEHFDFQEVDGNRTREEIHQEILKLIERVL